MNIRSLFVTLTLVSIGMVATVSAQDVKPVEEGKVLIHNVVRGETLYSLAKRYGVTIDEITNANQELVNGLKEGQRIKIPSKILVADSAESATAIAIGDAEEAHEKRGDDRTKRHKPKRRKDAEKDELTEDAKGGEAPVEEAEAKQADSVAVGLRVDSTSVAKEPEKKRVSFTRLDKTERAKIALMLPLGSEAAPAVNFIDFYRGFAIGLDSLRRAGISADISLYNTAHRVSRVDSLISSHALDSVDMVIGPVYEEELARVSEALKDSNVPIVSPLARLKTISDSLMFQMAPAQTNKLDKVRGLFDGSKRVVILYTDRVDKKFDAEVRGMLRDTSYVKEHQYTLYHPNHRKAKSLPNILAAYLHDGRETVFVITANNEVEVDRLLAMIASAHMAVPKCSSFVVYANNRWERFVNIDRTVYFTANVTQLTSYHTSYTSKKMAKFDKRYVAKYGALPTLYAYRGFDAAVVFISSLYKGIDDFTGGKITTPLLSPYSFERDERGVYVNTYWIKENYNSDFSITIE